MPFLCILTYYSTLKSCQKLPAPFLPPSYITDLPLVTDTPTQLLRPLQIHSEFTVHIQAVAFYISIGMLVAENKTSRIFGRSLFLLNQADILKEDNMKSGNRDKVEGTFHELKGKAREVVGKLSDNPKLQVAGTVEKLAGKVQGKIGQVKQVIGK